MTVSRMFTPSSVSATSSLSDVLLDLGHDCPLGCSRAASELAAPVVLVRSGLPVPTTTRPTLVVVDSGASGAPLARSHQLVKFLDRCARQDGIRIRDRRASDVPLRRPQSMPAEHTTNASAEPLANPHRLGPGTGRALQTSHADRGAATPRQER